MGIRTEGLGSPLFCVEAVAVLGVVVLAVAGVLSKAIGASFSSFPSFLNQDSFKGPCKETASLISLIHKSHDVRIWDDGLLYEAVAVSIKVFGNLSWISCLVSATGGKLIKMSRI